MRKSIENAFDCYGCALQEKTYACIFNRMKFPSVHIELDRSSIQTELMLEGNPNHKPIRDHSVHSVYDEARKGGRNRKRKGNMPSREFTRIELASHAHIRALEKRKTGKEGKKNENSARRGRGTEMQRKEPRSSRN